MVSMRIKQETLLLVNAIEERVSSRIESSALEISDRIEDEEKSPEEKRPFFV